MFIHDPLRAAAYVLEMGVMADGITDGGMPLGFVGLMSQDPLEKAQQVLRLGTVTRCVYCHHQGDAAADNDQANG